MEPEPKKFWPAPTCLYCKTYRYRIIFPTPKVILLTVDILKDLTVTDLKSYD